MDTFDVDGDGSCDKEEFKSWFDGSVASVQFTFLDALCGTGLCRGSGVKFFLFFFCFTLWPFIVCSRFPVTALQIRTVLSSSSI
jgi:hypothetical protein